MYQQGLLRKLKKILKMKNEETFFKEYTSTWIKAGGLISQTIARRLLERTKGRVTQMIKEGKLTPYVIEGVTYLSFAEVWAKAEKIQTKIARDKAEDELKKLGLGKDINSGLMAQLDEVLNYDPNEPEI